MWFLATGRKKNRRSGFTLAETLLTVLIISVVFGAVAGGVGVTRRAYDSVTQKSRAGQMLSLASARLKKDLETAGGFEIDEDRRVVSFISIRRNASMTYRRGEKGMVYVILSQEDEQGGGAAPLLSEKECPGGLKVEFEKFRLSEDGRSVSITLMIKDRKNKVVEKQTYVWRAVNSYTKVEEEK